MLISELSNSELIEAYIPTTEILDIETVYETAPNSRRLEKDAGHKIIDTAVDIATKLI